MQIYERVTTISEPGLSGNLIKKGLLFHKCQPSLGYPFWSLSSETRLYFFSLSCSALPHTHTFTLHKQKTAHVYPTGLKTGLRGQASWARLLPDTTAELHVTPPRTVLVWSDRVDKATPALRLQCALAPPSTPTAYWSCRPVLRLPLLSKTLWNW